VIAGHALKAFIVMKAHLTLLLALLVTTVLKGQHNKSPAYLELIVLPSQAHLWLVLKDISVQTTEQTFILSAEMERIADKVKLPKLPVQVVILEQA